MKKNSCSIGRRVSASCAVLFLVLLAAAPAMANTDYTVLLDLDNKTTTGCTVATAAGSFAGADQQLITTVSSSSPLMVVSVVRQLCVSGPSTWGSPTPVTSPFATPWPVGVNVGTGGLDVVETYVPLGVVQHGVYRLGFVSSAGAGDALLTVDGTPAGAPIQISNLAVVGVPTLSFWMIFAVAISLAIVGLTRMKAPHALSVMFCILLLLAVGGGLAWATINPDGDPSGWAGIPPLASRTPVPAAGSSKIAAVFGTIVNDVLFLRIDADVPEAPVVATQPADTEVASGNSADFTSTATGVPAPAVQWQVSTDGATWNDVPGATTTTLTFVATAADDQNQYRAVFTNLAGSVNSDPATLTVATLATVTTQPANNTVASGGNASFTSTATASPAATVQWQVSTDNATWNDVSGATSTTLTFVTTPADHLKRFRAVFTNFAGPVDSDPAFLFVGTLGNASLPFSDAFNNTADGQLQLSAGWTNESGDYTIAANQATAATTQVNLARLNGVSGANLVVQADLSSPPAGQFGALVARYAGPVDTNMYYAGVRNTGGTFTAEIWKNVGGTATQIASQPLASGSGTLQFTVSGTSLSLKINNVLVASATDSSISAAGSVGMRATQGVVFDNFSVQ